MKGQLKRRFRDPEGDDLDELEEVKAAWWEDEGSVKDAIAGAVMYGALRAAFIVGAAAVVVFAFFRFVVARGL